MSSSKKVTADVTNDTFDKLIDKSILNNIEKIHGSLTKDDEFEFVFFSNKYNIERQKRLNRLKRQYMSRFNRMGKSTDPMGKFMDKKDVNNISQQSAILQDPSLTVDNTQGLNIMGSETFVKLLEIMKHRSRLEKLDLISKKTLDINYSIKNDATYRLTLDDLDTINKYNDQLINMKNHVIFKFLLELYQQGNDKITLIKKTRENMAIIDIEELDIRLKKSVERHVTKEEIKKLQSIDETVMDLIDFRFKERVSLIVTKTKDETISLDLTKIKSTHTISRLENEIPTFELELELTTDKPTVTQLTKLYDEITKVLKVVNQSSYIVTNSEKAGVLNKYATLLDLNPHTMKSLYGRRPESLEIQHVVDKLPNVYSVTDKADGERYQLIIHDNIVYLISDNLKVKKTGIVLQKEQKEYNNTILDGEYIYIPHEHRHIYMAFDCLIKSGENIREMNLLSNRLSQIDELVDNIFTLPGHKGTQIDSYDVKNFEFNIDNILKFHESQIIKFMNNLNHDIKLDKKITLVRRKYFIFPFGRNDNEIFQYSVLLWNLLVVNNNVACPYKLDGLIYTPQDQKYIATVKESKYIDYKWKTSTTNSIDFYIQFERNSEGKIIVAYDNSGNKQYSKDKPYKIAQLFVGKVIKDIEEPVHFQPQYDRHLAYLFLDNGEVRDLEGKIIQDRTVVEFYYNNDINVPRKFRWVPIRTRYDKTEYMQRHGKKYGNYFEIANKNWRSIENPFTFNDMLILSRDATYVRHLDILRNKIDHSVIISEAQENAFYQITTNLGKSMGSFYNWIKSITMYTYMMKWYSNGMVFDVLDFGCGRGTDLMRMYYVEVRSYLGLDKDNNGLISPVNGAISRYNQMKKNKDNFPPMSFINADVTVLLEPEEQEKVISNMSIQNKALMQRFFPKDDAKKQQFNCINCQFSIQYYASNETAWNNFLNNINLYLKPGGLFIVSAFDADLVVAALRDKTNYVIEYVNDKGATKPFMDIIKKYDDNTLYEKNDIIGIGKPIDVYNATISQEGNYMTEYLIQPKFLIKEFLEKCNLELIDMDTYENQYYLQEKYLKYYAKYEANPKTRKFLLSSVDFYDQNNQINKASFQMSRLNRFYAFKKKGSLIPNADIINTPVKDKELVKTKDKELVKTKPLKGGKQRPLKGMGKLLSKDFFKMDIKNIDKNNLQDHNLIDTFTFYDSILDILKKSDLVPPSITLKEFFEDKLIPDSKITTDDILEVCNNLSIEHEILKSIKRINTDLEIEDDKSTQAPVDHVEKLLDGLNIIILRKDPTKKKVHVNKYYMVGDGSDKVIILNEGNGYKPIYKKGGRVDNYNKEKGKGEQKIIGLFNINDESIKKIV